MTSYMAIWEAADRWTRLAKNGSLFSPANYVNGFSYRRLGAPLLRHKHHFGASNLCLWFERANRKHKQEARRIQASARAWQRSLSSASLLARQFAD